MPEKINNTALLWEQIAIPDGYIGRTRTPTGWLVREVNSVVHLTNESMVDGYDWRTALVFVPDPEGVWLLEPKQSKEPVCL